MTRFTESGNEDDCFILLRNVRIAEHGCEVFRNIFVDCVAVLVPHTDGAGSFAFNVQYLRVNR